MTQVYRVFAHLSSARPGEPGHATYVYPQQTKGRWDNYTDYRLIYVAASPEGAIGESFGRFPEWSDAMFNTPYLPGARSALATFTLDDRKPLLDFDDAQNLLDRNLKPTQVVIQSTTFTQPLALTAFREANLDGDRRWAGIRWWSFWKPDWPVVAAWMGPADPYPMRLDDLQPLDINSPVIRDAARTLVRRII